jgi:predicted nucleic acid-binding protein
MIFVDSNIIIDLVEPSGVWRNWSEEALIRQEAPLVTSSVVLAEAARQFRSLDDELKFLEALQISLLELTPAAAFRAGKAHAEYRAAGGPRDTIIADFLIGGHAATLDASLLTRDRARFATYFPELALITPETSNG